MKYYNYEVKLEEIDLINILGNLLSIKEDHIISITHVFIGNKFIPLN